MVNHNISSLVNEAANLSARALLHRLNPGVEFVFGDKTYVGSIRAAEILEREAAHCNEQAAAIRANALHVGKASA